VISFNYNGVKDIKIDTDGSILIVLFCMTEIHIFKNIEQLAEFTIGKWSEISSSEVRNKGYFSVALSGGKTPVAFFNKLAGEKAFPWRNTHVFMVDERFVPYESDENNYHMINRILLRHVNISPKNVHPVLTSEISPEAAAERYENDIVSYCRTVRTKMPRFDLILLGIGEDGHTGSLFPGTPSLKETRRLAISVRPPVPSLGERITLTLPVINNAQNIFIMAAGANKARIVKEVIEDKNHMLPAAMVNPGEGNLVFLLDEVAGSLLSGK
jgi:6-phosphogluconolactonase